MQALPGDTDNVNNYNIHDIMLSVINKATCSTNCIIPRAYTFELPLHGCCPSMS